jgi:hypothetical protein
VLGVIQIELEPRSEYFRTHILTLCSPCGWGGEVERNICPADRDSQALWGLKHGSERERGLG